MNITKLVSLLEEIENSITKGDMEKAKDIVGFLIDDIIKFEMAHENNFKIIHDVVQKILRDDNDEIMETRILGGDIVGEA